MDHQTYFLLLLPPLIFIIFILKHFSSHQNKNHPPSPPSLPVIGHLHLLNLKNPLYLTLTSLSSLYGPIFSLRLGCKSFLIISSPSAVEESFTTNDVVFANRPTSVAGDHLTYNYSSYSWSPYGHLWRVLRRLTVVELFSSHSLQRSAHIREEEMLRILRLLRKESGKRVDLNNVISTFSFNVVMRGIAGKLCVGEEEIGTEAGREILRWMRAMFSPTVLLGMCDYFPILRMIGYKGLEKNAVLMQKKRDKFLQAMVDEIREKSSVAPAAAEDKMRGGNLTERLLSVQASGPDLYNDDVIKSILVVMLAAGTDTSALTMEWAMSNLLTQPHVLQKLQQEIDNNVGHDHLINDADLPKLPYLRCVVNETLRLHPVAPLLLPHLSSEQCRVGGYDIPRGTILLVNAWAVHRGPSQWDDPEKFYPERFEGLEAEREGSRFLPFGTGRRACPGAAMAMRTVSLALGAFVQCFEWGKGDVEVDFGVDLAVTLRKAKPLEAVCVVRNEALHLL
ncbi:cytochrome P450 81C13-like [Salvia divinorum]|uniref:Cytochrome P450 81C13-like n=1 Tax=Salvia divinorum TaxID=28513 RepID=A0ABD1FQT0_SALDI